MKKFKKATKQRMIWAVDPFAKDPLLQKTAVQAIASLTQQIPATVQPVYCFGEGGLEVPLDVSAGLLEHTRALAEKKMARILGRTKLPELEPLLLLVEPGVSLTGRVNALIDHARETKADFIVACTRAQKGLARWLTGSFTETLMLRSDIPLFLVNPHRKPSPRFKHILFPTDFSNESREAYAGVLDLARQLGASITIFHKVRFDLLPAADVAFSAYSAYKEAFDDESHIREAEAQRWAKDGEASGVKVNTIIEARLNGTAPDSILKAAAKLDGIIAMAAHSGAVARVVLGSTTRQVARASKWPLWIVHPLRHHER
ncbi:universal stress protein [Bdellovibrionota bacterium FG-1]